MNKQKTKGYSLKKRKLKKWLYTHHLNQYFIAKKLNLKIEELKEKLNKRFLFNQEEITKLIYIVGAKEAVKIIYFPTIKEKQEVYYKTFGCELKEVIKKSDTQLKRN